jgi:two-component system CheB/CheR fusion protein
MDHGLEGLLQYLKVQRGFDFAAYKRSTIERRLAKRMQAVGVEAYEDYVDYLEVHPDEFEHLFDTILINVTGFFRDADAWRYVADEVVPRILAGKGPGDPIRVWSAGCASGEETYTLAMVLAEALGLQEYLGRVKIYATDADDGALDTARQGTFTAKALEAVPPEFVERYFERADRALTFRKDLRRSVIFGRNDLLQDAPISRIDLLVCRNTLMYFNAEAQSRILSRFHFALNPDGFLYVGKSEMLITHGDLFAPLSLKRRVFTKVPRATLRERLIGQLPVPAGAADPPMLGLAPTATLRDAALEAGPVAQLVVDRDGVLGSANREARGLLSLRASDVGRPLKDLEVSYRPVELRGPLEALVAGGLGTVLESVEYTTSAGDRRVLDVQISPLMAADEIVGAAVAYLDVTGPRALEQELERSKRELEHSYEELQSTVEELETTNEELQSTNEELETTNEELQSTNEELETMNEELQSTNDELETMNEELRRRSTDLNEVNAFLETVLTSLRLSVVVVDADLHVRIWNALSEEYWGLRREEAEGAHFLGLDIGLPVDELKQTLRLVLDGGSAREELLLAARDRRGRDITCGITVLPMRRGEEVSGAILLMQDRAQAPGGPA